MKAEIVVNKNESGQYESKLIVHLTSEKKCIEFLKDTEHMGANYTRTYERVKPRHWIVIEKIILK